MRPRRTPPRSRSSEGRAHASCRSILVQVSRAKCMVYAPHAPADGRRSRRATMFEVPWPTGSGVAYVQRGGLTSGSVGGSVGGTWLFERPKRRAAFSTALDGVRTTFRDTRSLRTHSSQSLSLLFVAMLCDLRANSHWPVLAALRTCRRLGRARPLRLAHSVIHAQCYMRARTAHIRLLGLERERLVGRRREWSSVRSPMVQ